MGGYSRVYCLFRGQTGCRCRSTKKQPGKKQSRFIGVDFELRFLSGWQQVRNWVTAGRIGKIEAVHFQGMWDGHKNFGELAARREAFLNSNGCLDCGIHQLDLARFITGGGAWSRIHALGAWFGETVRFPPHLSIQAMLEPGIIATFNESFAFTAYIDRSASNHAFTLIGKDGVIFLQPGRGGEAGIFHLVCRDGEEQVPISRPNEHKPIRQVIEAFVKAATGKKKATLATGEDGLHAQILMDTANNQAICNREQTS